MVAEATHRNSHDAKNDVDERISRLIKELKPLKIKRENIVASSLHLNPNYEFINQKRVFNGYRASRNITITLHKLEQLSNLMDLALKSGINHISPVQLQSSQEEKYQLLAQQSAIEDSKRKAETLAKAYGAELGPIFRIEYRNTQIHYPRIENFNIARAASLTSRDQPAQYSTYTIGYDSQIISTLFLT